MAIKITITAEDNASDSVKKIDSAVDKLSKKMEAHSSKMKQAWSRAGMGMKAAFTDMGTLADKYGASIGKLHNKIRNFVAVGIGALVAATTKAVKMFADQEQAMRRLQTAVEISGRSWNESKEYVQSFLNEIQKTTRFADNKMAGSLQMITQLTGSLKKGFEGSKLAADMASSGMFDLQGASRYVAMAMEGNVEMLGRYLPQLKASYGLIKENMSASEKWAIAKDLLNKKFGGSSEKDLLTFSGILKSLKNYLGDVAEKAGEVIAVQLMPHIKKWRDAIIQFVETGGLEKWANNFKQYVVLVIDKIKSGIEWIIDHKDWFKKAFIAIAIAAVAVELLNVSLSIFKIVKAVKEFEIIVKGSQFIGVLSGSKIAGGVGLIAALAFTITQLVRLFKAMKEGKKSTDELNESTDLYANTLERVNEFLKSPEAAKLMSEGYKFKMEGGAFILDQPQKEEIKTDWRNLGEEAGKAFGEGLNKKAEGFVPTISGEKRIPEFQAPKLIQEPKGGTEAFINTFGEMEDMVGAFYDAGISNELEYWESIINIRTSQMDVIASQYGKDTDQYRMALAKKMSAEKEFSKFKYGVIAQTLESAFSSAFNAIFSKWTTLWDKAQEVLMSFVNAFVSLITQVLAKYATAALLSFIFPGLGSIGMIMGGSLFHRGGIVGEIPKYHSGGLRGNERLTVQQVGEYDVKKSSVTAETMPQLSYINQTGKPLSGTSVNVGDININGKFDIDIDDMKEDLRNLIIEFFRSRRLTKSHLGLT